MVGTFFGDGGAAAGVFLVMMTTSTTRPIGNARMIPSSIRLEKPTSST